MNAGEAKRGAALLAVGALPLAVGAALPLDGDGPSLWCPFAAATGLPCPLCGGTRAVVHLAHGDADLWSYNAPWALLLVALALAGAAGLLAATRDHAPLGLVSAKAAAATRTPSRMLAAIALVAAVPWAWALANAGTIV